MSDYVSDSGSYTCVVTNQASHTISTNSSVEMHQLPAFFLEPDNADVYMGDSNGAVFQSNATGFPFPGFRWYFQQKGTIGYIQLPGEDENELVIHTPLPKDEGSYCSYMTKLSSGKTFAVFADFQPIVKVFPLNYLLCTVHDGHGRIHRKNFPVNSVFCAQPRKFCPSKVLPYTVLL